MTSSSRLVDDGLFASIDPLTLRGGRCTTCGTVTFPAQDTCPRCSAQHMAAHPLPTTGIVWSWTAQYFEPKPPFRPPAEGFVPYLLGYVDLGEVVIETRLAGSVDGPPAIGDTVELTGLPVFADHDGTQVVTFGFARVAATTGAATR